MTSLATTVLRTADFEVKLFIGCIKMKKIVTVLTYCILN